MQRRQREPFQSVDSFLEIVEGIALVAGLLFFGWLAYKALSIEFLRPIAIGVLLFISIPFVIVAFCAFKAFSDARLLRAQHQFRMPSERPADPELVEQLLIVHSARGKIKSLVDEHLETLARRRIALVTQDHYGIVDSAPWTGEVQRFADKVVRPRLSELEANAIAPQMSSIFQELLEDRVRLRAEEIERDLKFSTDLTPENFESWCASVIRSHGWNATVTKTSGDQGADVVADKSGVRIVLQCKLYSGSVGNKAVQEAFAAQRHYAVHRSAVVTNADFTKSARELASTTGVLLLHYSDLTRLDELLSQHS